MTAKRPAARHAEVPSGGFAPLCSALPDHGVDDRLAHRTVLRIVVRYVVKVDNPPTWIGVVHGWVRFTYLLLTLNPGGPGPLAARPRNSRCSARGTIPRSASSSKTSEQKRSRPASGFSHQEAQRRQQSNAPRPRWDHRVASAGPAGPLCAVVTVRDEPGRGQTRRHRDSRAIVPGHSPHLRQLRQTPRPTRRPTHERCSAPHPGTSHNCITARGVRASSPYCPTTGPTARQACLECGHLQMVVVTLAGSVAKARRAPSPARCPRMSAPVSGVSGSGVAQRQPSVKPDSRRPTPGWFTVTAGDQAWSRATPRSALHRRGAVRCQTPSAVACGAPCSSANVAL